MSGGAADSKRAPAVNAGVLAAFFEFDRLGTNLRRELIAGATTFAAMAHPRNAPIPTGPRTFTGVVYEGQGTSAPIFKAN